MLCNCVNNGTCVELTELEKSNAETRLVFLLVQFGWNSIEKKGNVRKIYVILVSKGS